MSTILGLSHPFCYNGSACLISGDEIVGLIEEERLSRVKFAPKSNPELSAKWVLDRAGIAITDVDAVSIGMDRFPGYALNNLGGNASGFWGAAMALYFLGRGARAQAKIPRTPRSPIYVNHHLAHAATAFYCSPFEEANILVLDGTGGDSAGLLARGSGAQIDVLQRVPNDSSWGTLYSAVTRILGFRWHKDEYKVMGLAAYGKPNDTLFDFVDLDADIPRYNTTDFVKFLVRQAMRVDTADPVLRTVPHDRGVSSKTAGTRG